MNKIIKGISGEVLAKEFLLSKKYKILETNFKTIVGEIDIIAEDNNAIVFVEVKARETARFGLPREAVTPYKQNRVRQVAMQYLRNKKLLNRVCRFDVIDILGGEITHIENAF